MTVPDPVPAWGSFADLAADAAVCTKCPLAETRTQGGVRRREPPPDLVFVGEGPGAEEDRQGIPFVGRAGQLLTRLIDGIGLHPRPTCTSATSSSVDLPATATRSRPRSTRAARTSKRSWTSSRRGSS